MHKTERSFLQTSPELRGMVIFYEIYRLRDGTEQRGRTKSCRSERKGNVSKKYERTRITDFGTKQNAGQQLQGRSGQKWDHAAEWGESKAPLMHPTE